jgi:predicted Ser/Thr protein kinase
VDELTVLVAGLLSGLHAVAPEVFPGSWAWTLTMLGVLVGLVPAAGAVLVALLRRATGSSGGGALLIVAIGVLTAGVVPLLAFIGAGQVMVRAPGVEVSGLDSADLRSLDQPVGVPVVADYLGPLFSSQAQYLSSGSVAGSFTFTEQTLYGFLPALLVGLPLLAVLFVLVQARTALRRGPRGLGRAFWLSLVAVAVLTAAVPAWTAVHLWFGVGLGAFAGMLVVPFAGAPRERGPRPAAPARPEPVRTPPVPPARDAAEPRASLADRMAARFSGRAPEPPVVAAPPTGSSASSSRPVPARGPATGSSPRRAPHPTMVAPLEQVAGPPRFRLVRRLGAGGFGKVWLAEDSRLGRTVALKAAHAPDAETEQRIEREAMALRSVRHPHCVRIFDLVSARSDPGLAELDGMVIVMEYVEGQSLGDLVRGRGVLDDIAAARVWASVAGALDAAHGIGVMHRDVKPGNVIVDPSGLAHLIDFGIARRSGDATLTQAGFVLGTPDFLAPEVAAGQRATPESDSWQLAATISYALTGHPPRGGHPDAVSGLRAAAAGAPLSHLPPRSAHLALLHAAMHNDPARRPPLHAARHALEDWLRRAGASPDGPVTAVYSRP